MSREPGVAGVVLAAGSSTRMGRNKLLLELDGEALVRRAVRTAHAAGLDGVRVVLGHEADRVRDALAGLDCEFVMNTDHAQGIRTSLQAGIAAVAASSSAALVLLGDMPFVTRDMLEDLVLRYRRTGAPLVVARYGDVQAPPTLYDRALFDEIRDMNPEGCAKQVIRRHKRHAELVFLPESGLRDIDQPADFEAARTELAKGRP